MGKPIVAIKTGRSEVAQKMVVSHTASLAGSDDLVSALFERLGVARVDSLEALMEALKVLHVLGPLDGGRIGAMSTSGGDLTLLADAMGANLTMPPLSDKVARDLRAVVHERVVAANPFDYQMFNWDEEDHMAAKFTAFLSEDFDVALCLLDFDPCHDCDRPCHRACPRGAFRSGAFERALCKQENDQREADFEILDGSIMGIEEPSEVTKPCRFCEFACPVAQGSLRLIL